MRRAQADAATVASMAAQRMVFRGVLAMACAVLLFSGMDAIAKWTGGHGFNPAQIVFFRYLFGLIPMGVAVGFYGVAALRTRRPFAHLLRALLLCTSLLLFFWGVKYLPLAEAMAVAFTSPLFITALSVPILGEKVGLHRWAAVLIGFVGMLVIVQPGTSSFQIEALYILASAFLFAVGALYTRLLSRTETNAAIFTATTIIAGMVMLPLAWPVWVSPGSFDLMLFLILGIGGGTAHFLVIVAYRNAPAAVNAPIEYSALIWGAVLGWVIWNEVPEMSVWIGAGVIALAGGYIAYRESRVSVANTSDAPD